MRGEIRKNIRGDWRVLLVCPRSDVREMVLSSLASLGVRSVTRLDYYPERSDLDSMLGDHHVCLIDVSSDHDLALPLVEKIAAANVSLIAIHGYQDLELQLQYLRRGVTELVSVPIDVRQLQSALARVAARRDYLVRASRQPGEVYAVMSGKGGAGSTTIATHLALSLAAERPRKTLLVDADGITGSVAFSLQGKPAFSLLDIPADLDRMDEDLWRSLVTVEGPLDLLLAPARASLLQMPAGRISELLQFWRSLYDAVVIDLSVSSDELGLGFAREADMVLMISTCDLSSVYSTTRRISYLEASGLRQNRVKVVLNRCRPSFALEGWDKVAEQPVFARVSEAGDALQKALLNGKPMPAESTFGVDVTALARQVTGWPMSSLIDRGPRKRRAIEPAKSLASRFFGMVNSKPSALLSIRVSDANSPQ